jgi:hypothetical protein
MVSMSAGRRRCFCRNLHSQHAVTLRILGFEMYRNSASYPASEPKFGQSQPA